MRIRIRASAIARSAARSKSRLRQRRVADRAAHRRRRRPTRTSAASLKAAFGRAGAGRGARADLLGQERPKQRGSNRVLAAVGADRMPTLEIFVEIDAVAV